MSYLILQMIVWLAGAALLGVAFGWLLARRDLDARIEEERSVRAGVVADWQSRYQEAVDLGDAARARIASLESELDILRGELQTKAERQIQLESRIERAAAGLRKLEEGSAGRSGEVERVRTELHTAEERLAGAQSALADKDGIIAQLQRGLAERDKQIPALQTALSSRDAEARTAQRLVDELGGRVQSLEGELGGRNARIAELEEQLAGRAARVTELESAPGDFQLRATENGSVHLRDDLKQIRGVGPKLERILNAMGVFHYRQIAAWTDEEIDGVQAKMEGVPHRIRRDNWVEGAKAEHKKKYGVEL